MAFGVEMAEGINSVGVHHRMKSTYEILLVAVCGVGHGCRWRLLSWHDAGFSSVVLLVCKIDAAKAYDCAAFRMRRGQKAILDFPLQSEANPKPNNNGRKRRIHQRGMS
ncbi:DNA-binding domain-containing protein [Trifolium repens]|nr:DNA-binding domain-containing protein [Trifolium repens]